MTEGQCIVFPCEGVTPQANAMIDELKAAQGNGAAYSLSMFSLNVVKPSSMTSNFHTVKEIIVKYERTFVTRQPTSVEALKLLEATGWTV